MRLAPSVLRSLASRALLLFLMFAMVCAPAVAASKMSQLPVRYREWLQKDVLWIISDDEKKTFLGLESDEQREDFIKKFWEIRNPTPGGPDNPYRTELYKRLAYTIQYFSTGADDGYKTARGQIYITLGPPQQKEHHIQSETRPLEIWFYQNAEPLFMQHAHAALPPFFYVAFYDRDGTGDWRLYSPLFDGPAKLVTSHHAENGLKEAVESIKRDLGGEVARVSLSLIPDEPVNIRNPDPPTMTSDLMLGVIKNLRNHPFTIDYLNERRRLDVTSHRIIVPGEYLNVTAVPIRDGLGDTYLHYSMRLNKPQDFAIAKADNKIYFSVEAAVRVMTPDGKAIYTQDKKIARNMTDAEVARNRDRPFGVEGVLPLAPGKYKLEFLFTNVQTKTTFTTTKEDVVVPENPAQGWHLGPVTAFLGAETLKPEQIGRVPFSFGPVKFVPVTEKEVALTPGQDLQVFFQVLGPAGNPKLNAGKKLIADYAYGSLSQPGGAQTIREELARDMVDAHGSMLTGKTIPTADLKPGVYRLSITLTDPETLTRSNAALGFKVLSSGDGLGPAWDVYPNDIGDEAEKGTLEYQRALTYLANGNQSEAVKRLAISLQRDPANEGVRAHLVEYFFARQDFKQVLALYEKAPVTAKVDDDTVLRVAGSYEKLGDLKGAANFIESAVKVKGPSGTLYVTLASYYQRLGNPQKAEELERKGRELLNSAAAAPAPPS